MNNRTEIIQTAVGPIQAKNLGRTYIHEHLRINLSAQKNDPDADLNEPAIISAELRYLKKLGIDSLIEVTNLGMGRDVAILKQLAEASGINVIVSTGFYKEPFLPPYVMEMDEASLAAILSKEILYGIDDTGIKAQVIGEIGTSKNEITPDELKIFKAAARAHQETGAPISTHTTLGTMAIEQLKILQEEQVALSKVVIGHLDLHCDFDYYLRIADYSCFLGFDTIGKLKYESDEKRSSLIEKLIRKGYLNQIVLSQDITRRSHLKANGGTGYSYLWEEFIPKLIMAGVGADEIDIMLIDNPQRLLAG
mgnify:CR=1 FL=1